MPTPIPPASVERFYRAALLGLRALDARERTPRRFGADADQRWKDFRGHLRDTDRLDVLVRDAAVTWGPAFAAGKVFGLPGLAEDEPFGPEWPGLPDDRARRLWNEQSSPGTLESCALALGVAPARIQWAETGPAPFGRFGLTPPSPEVVLAPRILPSTRLLLTGGGAIFAIARHFASNPELRWADQVLVIASDPRHRQLAGLAALFLGEATATRLLWPEHDAHVALQRVRFTQVSAAIASHDALEQDIASARQAVGAA